MRAFFFICLTGLLFATGCSNYRLGTAAELKFRTIHIEPVINATQAPQVVAMVSTQIREAFLHDPRVVLVNTTEEADVTLSVKLVRYARDSQTRQSNDTGLTRKFDVILAGEATLRDNRSNELVFEKRKVQAVRQIFTDNGQQLQAEYNNVPLLAETLAKNVLGATLDVW